MFSWLGVVWLDATMDASLARIQIGANSAPSKPDQIIHSSGSIMARSTGFGGERDGFFCMRYFAGGDSPRPRYFSIAFVLGAAPRQDLYILARSSVLPRERTIRRKRSPLARVNPPLSTNHW